MSRRANWSREKVIVFDNTLELTLGYHHAARPVLAGPFPDSSSAGKHLATMGNAQLHLIVAADRWL